MKNITVGIYETEMAYGKRLAAYISGYDRSPFITGLYLEHPAADPQAASDVMIITSSLWPLYREAAGDKPVLLLDEDGMMPASDGVLTIFKYQSAAAIYAALTDLCLNTGRWRMAMRDTGKKAFEILGICRPARSGEAVRDRENYLADLAGQGKMLCISLEPVCSRMAEAEEGPGTMAEVIYYLRQGRPGLGSRVAMMAKGGAYDLILPAQVYSEVTDLSAEEWEGLITALHEETDYERLVFDFGCGPVPEAVFGCLTHMKILHGNDPWENEIAGRLCRTLKALEDPGKSSVIDMEEI